MKKDKNLYELAKQAMQERDLLPTFPPSVLKEAQELSVPSMLSRTQDLRDYWWFSIDHYDSKDLDQLSYMQQLPSGLMKVYVAIADVRGFVTPVSSIDAFAAHNTTSVYTPFGVFPMLPERLSTHLTSLKPDQERLAMVVEMSIDSTGNMLDYDLYPATVKSRAKLVYQQVADWLNHSVVPHPIYEDPLLQEQLRWHLEVTCLLQKYRESQGTLTLTSIEPYIRMNGQVQVTSMVNNCAYELIQNLMIAANTATALFMQKHHIPCLRRVIRTPKRWPRIVEIARHYGTHLPDEPSVQALESFLLEQKNKDSLRFPDLSLTIIKLLGRGEYIIENPEDPPQGHFNLGLQRYTHATAPNRRFSDLIIQRCLATLFDNVTLPYTQQELTLLAQRCTTKEVDAEKVERKIKKSAMIIALSPRIGDTFEAIVTGSSPKGTWVRLFNPPVEGKLVQGFQHVDVGDRLRVQLIHVDLDQGFIDFSTI